MSITTVNGRNKEKTAVLETEMITDTETLEAATAVSEAPETDVHPQPETEKKEKPRSKKRLPLILAGLSVGAIARQQLDAAKAAYDVALAQKNAAVQEWNKPKPS